MAEREPVEKLDPIARLDAELRANFAGQSAAPPDRAGADSADWLAQHAGTVADILARAPAAPSLATLSLGLGGTLAPGPPRAAPPPSESVWSGFGN
jgi:hypothetical protein